MEDINETVDAVFGDRVRRFQEFLDNEGSKITDYKEEIRQLLYKGEKRLTVSIDDVREFDKAIWKGLLDEPAEYLPAFERALRDNIISIYDPNNPSFQEINDQDIFYVSFKGAFGHHNVSPRTIKAIHLSKLISVEGIVTRASLVRPKVIRSVHHSEKTGRFHSRDFTDHTTSFNPISTPPVYPTEDQDGNKLTTEYGYSTYKDYQSVTVQEMPERAPAGQLPRSLEIVLNDDLVDTVKPGDRVQIVGVYRSLGNGSNTQSSFRTVILANSVYPLHARSTGVSSKETITDIDIRNINKISKKRNVFDLMAQSLAPSIYGHEYIKKAVLLMLLGGVEKNLDNGSHLRGDINILMVGDPSTAKSQMLRFVLNTAALAIATTGRGSSGVGLTAAVTHDKETGERRLEAGAMVLADRGIVCIDEFDKMSDIDRVAIHEVMEQQTVTIAKAGIHTSLNARCSVIAAANPVYGQYDVHKDPHQNIALPDSLLSRFDLLFIVTDDVNTTRDRALSEHMLRTHRFIPTGYAEGEPIREGSGLSLAIGNEKLDDENDPDQGEQPVYQKLDPLLHAGALAALEKGGRSKRSRNKILSIPFIRKYIQYAKSRVEPVLSQNASNHIVDVYSKLRNDQTAAKNTAPITARTLETLIRLATAHAKVRLSKTIDVKDTQVAETMLRFALFKEVLVKKSNKKNKIEVSEDEISDDEEEYVATPKMAGRSTKTSLRAQQFTSSQREKVRMGEMTSPTSSSQHAPEDFVPVEGQGDTQEDTQETQEAENLMENLHIRDAPTSPAASGYAAPLQSSPLRPRNADTQNVTISKNRYNRLFKIVANLVIHTTLFQNDEGCPLEALYEEINKRLEADFQSEEIFTNNEFKAGIEQMVNDGHLMVDEGLVYRI